MSYRSHHTMNSNNLSVFQKEIILQFNYVSQLCYITNMNLLHCLVMDVVLHAKSGLRGCPHSHAHIGNTKRNNQIITIQCAIAHMLCRQVTASNNGLTKYKTHQNVLGLHAPAGRRIYKVPTACLATADQHPVPTTATRHHSQFCILDIFLMQRNYINVQAHETCRRAFL